MDYAGFKLTLALRDLGEVRSDWAGIYSPSYADDFVQKFIHAPFLENAASYVDRYQNVPLWTQLLTAAEPFINLKDVDSPRILDVGSGAGNTIFPLFHLYPGAHIAASDLSIPLLKILQTLLKQEPTQRDCLLVQMNAEQMVFESNQMDLVAGGAILHHLFAPEKTLRECFRVLKPGCAAVFFEPFEIGHQVFALILLQLIRMDECQPAAQRIDPAIIAFFKHICRDFKLRKGSDKSAPVYREMDDKWTFSKDYLHRTAKALGFREVFLHSIHPSQNMFRNHVGTYLRLALQKDESALPEWARTLVREADEQFSEDLHHEMIFEGRIVLRK